jgi:hypothetical protein
MNPTADPSRDDTGTATCPACGRRFAPTGRQIYCRSACRKSAYRRRHQHPIAAVTVPAAQPRSQVTVYECPDCEQRLLGAQRCPDCAIFARRIDFGGACPHCDEPVALTDLLDPQMIQTLIPRVAVDNHHATATLQPTHRRRSSA